MKRLLFACLVLASLQCPARGASLLPTESYVLDNGLRVLLHQDRGYPLVMVHVRYYAGSGAERPGKSGLAHLAEHLIFGGSGRYEFMLGASHMNASTEFDHMDDYMMVPSVNLAGALAVKSGHMAVAMDRTWSPNLASERRVVFNERRQRLETQPFGAAEERLWQALFPAPHPYHGFNIGSTADMDAETLSDLRDFYRRNYGPATAVLAVVGDFEVPAAKELVRKYFGSLPPGPDPALRSPPPAPAELRGEVVLRLAEGLATHPRLTIAWHSPPFLSPGDAAADILAWVLSGGRAARLRQRLEAPGRACFVHAGQQNLGWQSVFQISMDAPAGADLAGLLREVDATLDEIRQGGVRPDELRRARADITTLLLSRLQTLPGQAEALHTYQMYRGEADWLAQDLERYKNVSAEDVKRLVGEHLRPDRRVVLFAEAGGGR